MTLPAEFLDELRNRVRLSDVVGRRVRLVKRGREHSGLCPFHNEKTPSFTVSDDKGFFHCFGCQAHGSVFDFVMRTEGLGFMEAVERLAAEAGLALPQPSPVQRQREEQARGLGEAIEAAAAWFEAQLQTAAGKLARDYIEGRGLRRETLARFRIGYAPPGRSALKEALVARGFAEATLLEAGLLIAPEDGGASFDRFRHRVMFPIADRRGRLVAFGGRALDPQARAKYLNSPETPLFHKGRLLYGLAAAREAIRAAGTAVVVEGYMDVVTVAQGGYGAVVAPLGTALTEDQMQELWRHAPEPILCFDGDAAGRRAAEAAAERAMPLLRPGHSLRFAFMPAGEDPDSLVRAQGRAAFEAVLADAAPLVEVLWRRESGARDVSTPERRAQLEATLRGLVERIGDATVRTYYERAMRERLWQAFGGRRAQRGQGGQGGGRGGGQGRQGGQGGQGPGGRSGAPGEGRGTFAGPAPPRLPSPGFRRERLLVVTLLNHPDLVSRLAEEFSEVPLADSDLDALRNGILEIAGSGAGGMGLDLAALREHLTTNGFSAILDRVAGPRTNMLDWFARPDAEPEDAEIGWRHVLSLHLRSVALPEEIAAAMAAFAAEPNEENQGRLIALKREEEALAGEEIAPAGFGVASGRVAGP